MVVVLIWGVIDSTFWGVFNHCIVWKTGNVLERNPFVIHEHLQNTRVMGLKFVHDLKIKPTIQKSVVGDPMVFVKVNDILAGESFQKCSDIHVMLFDTKRTSPQGLMKGPALDSSILVAVYVTFDVGMQC
jgi:hypothetical protein